MLVPRERVDERLPASVWPEHEEFAYAIRRFDRDEHRGLVHIEDLAQVRNVYPEQKYKGNFETVASLIYRGRDLVSTAYYFAGERIEDLGLKFGGSKDFHGATLATFRRLQERLGVRGIDLARRFLTPRGLADPLPAAVWSSPHKHSVTTSTTVNRTRNHVSKI
jgi:serine/threonine-protein kinase HipA